MLNQLSVRCFISPIILALLSIIFYTCSRTDLAKGERLARTHCASCHLFPEPSLLNKKTWENGVMPEMAFRMGLDFTYISKINAADRNVALRTIPDSPTLTMEDWGLIKKYYQVNSPDSLTIRSASSERLSQFEPRPWRQPGKKIPHITFAKADTISKTLWLADRSSHLYQLDYEFQLQDSIKLNSPASAILFDEKKNHAILTMGIMDPNDRAIGTLDQLMNGVPVKRIDSLNRPVHFESSDLNNDGLLDYVVCAFGNYTGALLVFENLGKQNFIKHTLISLPGTRKVVIKDLNHDGLQDIIALLAQGDEQIVHFSNAGGFNFRITTLLRFPPVYGSSYFEMADFNSDGKDDILYSNGDNADFSPLLKPYHGVRIFLNHGLNQYKESWFYPMSGTTQAIARDFDFDGDLDIAAISFFPDLAKEPEQGFVFLENQGQGLTFKPHTTPAAASGRWMTIDSFDIDGDRDFDILLAALNFDKGVPKELGERWKKNMTSLLLLVNKTR
jgi:FG-GAP-like repeat